DPQSANLQHVVRSAGVPEVAVLVYRVFVPRADPVPFDRVLRLLVLIPVTGADGVAADPEIADLAGRHRCAAVVEKPRVVAVDILAARSGTDGAGTVRNEHVQPFGRSDAVDDVDAEPLLEPLVQRGGKRFTGRDSEADAREIGFEEFDRFARFAGSVREEHR